MENISTTIINYLQVYFRSKSYSGSSNQVWKDKAKAFNAENTFSILQLERDLLQVYLWKGHNKIFDIKRKIRIKEVEIISIKAEIEKLKKDGRHFWLSIEIS